MAKPFNIALALSFTCLFLMLCVALAQHPSSDVTAAIGEDTDELADTDSKRNVSSQRAASWHARECAHTHNTKNETNKKLLMFRTLAHDPICNITPGPQQGRIV